MCTPRAESARGGVREDTMCARTLEHPNLVAELGGHTAKEGPLIRVFDLQQVAAGRAGDTDDRLRSRRLWHA